MQYQEYNLWLLLITFAALFGIVLPLFIRCSRREGKNIFLVLIGSQRLRFNRKEWFILAISIMASLISLYLSRHI